MKSSTTCRMAVISVAIMGTLVLSGCKKEDPNPEQLDRIFLDLEKRQKDAEKALEEAQKKLADARIDVEKAEPNTIELKDARREVTKAETSIVDAEQKAHYYKIRAERRKLVDKISYKDALAKNQTWPDPHEYSDYLVNMRLQEAPRNWAIRVPKLQDRLSNPGGSGKKEEKSEAKTEE